MPASRTRLPYAVAVAVAAVLATAGCGGTADEPTVSATGPAAEATPSPTGTPTDPVPTQEATPAPADDPAAPDGATVVEVTIAGGSVSTPESRVEVAVGSPVRLVVTSDTADELHVHGVDVEVPLAAGQPAVLDFVPAEPGLYDVETHDSHLLLVQVLAR